jgi:HAD superfamily hydrolase (TIGR01549 family)
VDPDKFWELMPAVNEEFINNGRIDVVTDENIQALDDLVRSGKRLMILTSRAEIEMLHLLDSKHHLASRIANFYYKENMTHHKPDPRAFEIIEREHGLKPEQCVYVGDSPSDAAAAKGAGLHFIACLESGVRTSDDFSAYPVDSFIQRFTDLGDAIVALDSVQAV